MSYKIKNKLKVSEACSLLNILIDWPLSAVIISAMCVGFDEQLPA